MLGLEKHSSRCGRRRDTTSNFRYEYRRKGLLIQGKTRQPFSYQSFVKAKSPPPDKLQLHIPLHFPSIALPDEAETVLASAYGSKINQSHEGIVI